MTDNHRRVLISISPQRRRNDRLVRLLPGPVEASVGSVEKQQRGNARDRRRRHRQLGQAMQRRPKDEGGRQDPRRHLHRSRRCVAVLSVSEAGFKLTWPTDPQDLIFLREPAIYISLTSAVLFLSRFPYTISPSSGKLTVSAHRLCVLEAIGGSACCPIKGEDAVDAVLEVVNGLASSLQVVLQLRISSRVKRGT